MIKEDVRAIIFDFGGIFINLDYTATIESFKQLGITNFADLYSQAQQSNLFDNYETGKISSQRFINGLLDFLPSNTTPNQIVAAWNAMLLDIDPVKINLLEELRKSYPVYLLSNTNALHIDVAFRRWKNTIGQPIHESFDKIYLSLSLFISSVLKLLSLNLHHSYVNLQRKSTLFPCRSMNG